MNLKRLQIIEKPDSDAKDKLYFVIDNIIQNTKGKKHSLRKIIKPVLPGFVIKVLKERRKKHK